VGCLTESWKLLRFGPSDMYEILYWDFLQVPLIPIQNVFHHPTFVVFNFIPTGTPT
jgi:hypothetical protein